jgi:hypothetical protein
VKHGVADAVCERSPVTSLTEAVVHVDRDACRDAAGTSSMRAVPGDRTLPRCSRWRGCVASTLQARRHAPPHDDTLTVSPGVCQCHARARGARVGNGRGHKMSATKSPARARGGAGADDRRVTLRARGHDISTTRAFPVRLVTVSPLFCSRTPRPRRDLHRLERDHERHQRGGVTQASDTDTSLKSAHGRNLPQSPRPRS